MCMDRDEALLVGLARGKTGLQKPQTEKEGEAEGLKKEMTN